MEERESAGVEAGADPIGCLLLAGEVGSSTSAVFAVRSLSRSHLKGMYIQIKESIENRSATVTLFVDERDSAAIKAGAVSIPQPLGAGQVASSASGVFIQASLFRCRLNCQYIEILENARNHSVDGTIFVEERDSSKGIGGSTPRKGPLRAGLTCSTCTAFLVGGPMPEDPH